MPLTPPVIQVYEYDQISVTYTMEYAGELGGVINGVTVTSSTGQQYPMTTTISGSSVTISGVLEDVFTRQMEYMPAGHLLNKVPSKTITKWKNLPSDFETVVGYAGPGDATITLTVTVDFSEYDILGMPGFSQSASASLIVKNNWMISNQKLTQNVAKGKY